MSSQPNSSELAPRSRWQFRLRSLFIWMLLVGVLLPTFGTSILFDLICFSVFATLAIRYRQRSQFAPWWTLVVTPLILTGASTPFILLDDQLTNWWMVGEVEWTTAVLSIAFGISGSLLVREWSLPHRFYPARFAFSAVVFVTGIALFTWMKVGHRGLPDLGVLNMRAAIERSSPHQAGGAHFVMHLPGKSSTPEMNYIRHGRDFYWSGARIDLAGWGLFYVRSRKSGGDYSLGPFLATVIPYWVMIFAGGAGAIHYSKLRSKMLGTRFSRTTSSLMLAASLAILCVNVWPNRLNSDPVLCDFGYPLRYLRLAIQNGERLDYYMGYSLGWQLDQMMLNVLLSGVVLLTFGLAIEWIAKRGE